MPITDAVIPVGGLGTRLLPATKSQPKEMLPVVRTPVVQYVVEELARAGIERVLFVTGRRKRAIEDHFESGAGVEVFYTRQAEPRGLGDALRCAESFAGGRPVVVALGDAIVSGGGEEGVVSRLARCFDADGMDAALAVEEVAAEDASRFGVVAVADPAARPLTVTGVVEKPPAGQAPSRFAVAARYVLGPRVFAALRGVAPDAGGEVQLADALVSVLGDGGRVMAVPLEAGERRHDVGTPAGYCATFIEFALRDPELGPRLRASTARVLDGLG